MAKTQTPARSRSGKPSWIARSFPAPLFYAGVGKVVFDTASTARAGRFNMEVFRQASDRIMAVLRSIGGEVTVDNIEAINKVESPCVFIGNHMSTLETFLLPGLILPYKPVTFVVKQSLIDYPVFGSVMRAADPVVVGRENPREDLRAVMEGGQERLKNGISIIVFPQTTRTPEFRRDQFNTIGVKLARRAGVPVVPVALKTDAWGNGRILKDFGRIDPSREVHFAFGEPIEVGAREKEVHLEVVEFIESHLKEWNQIG